MSHGRIESICSVLACTSDEFLEILENDTLSTAELAEQVQRRVIIPNRQRLREYDARYRLDDMLLGMLCEAPEPSGKRYTAVALHIAHEEGVDAVVAVAKAWLDYLFLPMLAISRHHPASSQTPTIDTTVQCIEGVSRSEQTKLRDTIAAREQNRCAITGAIDEDFVTKLLKEGRGQEIPSRVPQLPMEAAHIIPLLVLNDFSDAGMSPKIKDAARTLDMLQAWTSVDFRKLVGSNINSPMNAIFMSANEHRSFGKFRFYLDKQAFPNSPNKYKAQMVENYRTFSNWQNSMDVEFRAETQSGIESPNPQFLGIHAAFAKVLNLCGAVDHFEHVERDADNATTLRMDGTMDFGSLLMARLEVLIAAR